jgi:hypothetical protein
MTDKWKDDKHNESGQLNDPKDEQTYQQIDNLR